MASRTSLDDNSNRLSRRSLSDGAAQFIRRQIFGGVLRPRDHIPQDEIAAELGVSRLPVREALITLEAEGLIRLEPNRGAFVLQISRTDVLDHYQIVGHIHGIAASRAVENIRSADLDTLRRLTDDMALAQPPDAGELNWEFHRLINHLGGSRRLHTILSTFTRNIPGDFFESVEGSVEAAVGGHRVIVEALAAGDAVYAAEASRRHLEVEGNLVIRMMELHGFWSDDESS